MTKPSTEGTDDLDRAEIELDQAEQELRESLSLVSAIEDRVSAGDETVTSEDLASKHSLGRFAQLRVQALRSKVERLRGDAHKARCATVAADIQALADESGPALADALRDARDAVARFEQLATDRNNRLAVLRERVRELVPAEHAGPGTEARPPEAANARIGWQGSGAILLGRRHLLPVDAAVYISPATHSRRDGRDPADVLAHLDDERPGPAPDMRYFRGTNGMVIGYNRPLAPSEAQHLTPLTDAELSAYMGGGSAA